MKIKIISLLCISFCFAPGSECQNDLYHYMQLTELTEKTYEEFLNKVDNQAEFDKFSDWYEYYIGNQVLSSAHFPLSDDPVVTKVRYGEKLNLDFCLPP